MCVFTRRVSAEAQQWRDWLAKDGTDNIVLIAGESDGLLASLSIVLVILVLQLLSAPGPEYQRCRINWRSANMLSRIALYLRSQRRRRAEKEGMALTQGPITWRTAACASAGEEHGNESTGRSISGGRKTGYYLTISATVVWRRAATRGKSAGAQTASLIPAVFAVSALMGGCRRGVVSVDYLCRMLDIARAKR